eukprot:3932561-Rhodomonas_salina.2
MDCTWLVDGLHLGGAWMGFGRCMGLELRYLVLTRGIRWYQAELKEPIPNSLAGQISGCGVQGCKREDFVVDSLTDFNVRWLRVHCQPMVKGSRSGGEGSRSNLPRSFYLSALKKHPTYCIERDLRQYQVSTSPVHFFSCTSGLI